MPHIKLLVTDVDGTLTDKRQVISTKAIEALRLLESKGVQVSLASGNALPFLISLQVYIGLSGPIIAENGAIIYYPSNKSKVFLAEPRETRKAALELMKRYKWLKPVVSWPYREVDFAFYIPSSNYIEEVKRAVSEINSELKVYYSGFALHITYKKLSKGVALKKIIDDLGISRNEVAAIGDSETDISLFKESGFKIALSNSCKELKEIADLVVNAPNGEGVAKAIGFLLNSGL